MNNPTARGGSGEGPRIHPVRTTRGFGRRLLAGVARVMGDLLMATAYFSLLTPLGLLARLLRRDPLERRFDRTAPSYWRERPPPPPRHRYFRQY